MLAQRETPAIRKVYFTVFKSSFKLNRVPPCRKVINSKVKFWADCKQKSKLNHNPHPQMLKRAPFHQSSFSFHKKLNK